MNQSLPTYDNLIVTICYFISRQCNPNWIIEESLIDFMDMTYIYSGEADYVINHKTYHVKAGDLLCIPQHSLRSATTNPNSPMMCYPVNFLLYDFEHNEVSLPFPIVSHIGILDSLIHFYQELNVAWLEKKPGYILHSRTLFTGILYRLLSLLYYRNDLTFIDPRIKKVISYIAQHYTDKLSVELLAELVGLNPVYFGNLFKQCTGYSVKRYINQIKINHAENLLLGGEFTITATALKCGFDDIYYFSKLFKSIKGYSPSQVSQFH